MKTRGMECVPVTLFRHTDTHKHKKPAPQEHGSEDGRSQQFGEGSILKEDVHFPSLKSSS